MKNIVMLRWFVIFLSSLVSMGVIQGKGLFAALWIADLSGLSFITMILYLILTGFVGVLTHRLTNNEPGSKIYNENVIYMQPCWYGSELLMALGMMGTLIGFTMMLGPALVGLDPSNIVTAKSAIVNMAGGMSTAVLTTLVGLITSQLVKLQLINLDTSLPEK
jgi:hypothetical protein